MLLRVLINAQIAAFYGTFASVVRSPEGRVIFRSVGSQIINN